MMPLLVITALFSMSLIAAWVLFKILKSTATVTKPEYQLGGAAAGFVVILSILSLTYIQVNGKLSDDNLKNAQQQITELRQKVQDGQACLDAAEKAEVTYAGTVSPALQEANVIFAVTEARVQQDGRFAFKSNINPAALPSIYVIGPDSHTPYKQLFPDDKTNELTIPTTNH
jgi:hypothetical protein